MAFTFKKLFIFIWAILVLINPYEATAVVSNSYEGFKDREAIVLGKITKKQVLKLNNYYVTEYKLKIKKWIYKKPYIENKKTVTLRILGADLPDKGITIKASTSPDYIPLNTDAIFVLHKTKLNQNNIFTLSRNSIIRRNI
jgi:hypothetical protein